MANTYNANLIVDSVTLQAQTALAKRLAPLSLFSTDFSSDVRKPKETIQVKLATAGSATQTNPASFNSIGGSTVGAAPVTLDHLYQPFGLSYEDLNYARRLEDITLINLQALADKIWEVATAPITVANFGAATVTKADSGVTPTSGDLAKLWAAISKSDSKGLVVNPGIYSNLIPTNALSLSLTEGAYGFNRGVYFASEFPSEAKLAGFACDKAALAVASAQPAMAGFRENMIASSVIDIPALGGLQVYFNLWADNISRSHIASFELMFGSGKGLTTGTLASIYNP